MTIPVRTMTSKLSHLRSRRDRVGVRRGATLLVVSLALAACGSTTSAGVGGAATSSTTSTTAASPISSAPSSSTTTSTTTSTTAPPTTGRCRTSGLAVTIGPNSVGAGHVANVFTFTNIAATACTLYGYPGLQLLDAAGKPIATKVVRGAALYYANPNLTKVMLAPGTHASFATAYDEISLHGRQCSISASVEVTAPNAYGHTIVPAHMGPCDGGLIVATAVVAGSSGPPTR